MATWSEQAQSPVRLSPGVVRYVLGILLVVAALNAFGGGYYGMAGAAGVPTEWLVGTPFRSYFIPSLILFTVVGGASLGAAVAVLRGWPRASLAATWAALVVLGWIAVQIAIIGFVSWLQPLVVMLGLVILWLAQSLEP